MTKHRDFLKQALIGFCWNLILKLIQDMKKNPSRNSRINDKAANPDGYRKMDVGLAKLAFEDNNLAHAVELLCKQLGIEKTKLEIEVDAT
jgi:hypothetical protein